MTYSLAISVTYHDGEADKPGVETVHMMTYEDVQLTKEQAVAVRDKIVQWLTMSGNVGIYKIEHPREIH